jgi:hypothetical protein
VSADRFSENSRLTVDTRGTKKPRAVRQFVRGLRRDTRIAESRPVLTQEMITIINTCGSDIRGLRDRALLLVAFAGPTATTRSNRSNRAGHDTHG